MYKFKSLEEKERYNKTLEACIKDFKEVSEKLKNNQPKLLKIINKLVRTAMLNQLNHRGGTEHFFKNMDYWEQLNYDGLNYLLQNDLCVFTEEQKSWFNR
ncbi:hypothetical protein [Flavobacterium sp. GSP6]|uniref:hypothetical protein n=1 Tax=Flavobacterium sp. GSP6 TaxID=2497488 RepID=UPI000F884619|nr:hypothetical protein [Flavobacterium sp. GSP6]RTZ07292.1 hypothetical protein EKM03_03940 [Flavobacterium sp. GSP6]